MSKKNQKRIENELKDLINDKANNNKCGECGTDYPTWATVNLGFFLCGRCASLHRKLGEDVSITKSLTLDKWTERDLNNVAQMGNKRARKLWNPKNEPFPFDDDDKDEIYQYLRQKYILGKFRYEPPTPEDYNLSNSRPSLRRDRFSSSRSIPSREVPRLRHVDTPEIERLKYRKLEPKLQERGFNNMDDNYEALSLAKGDVSLAVDILNSSQSGSKTSDEKKPPLPRRPGTSASSASGPPPSSTSQPVSASSDWWNNNEQSLGIGQSSQPVTASSGLIEPPQQYLDPATGVIYVDPIQQQLYEQQQLQLQQQHTTTQALPAFGQQTGATLAYGQPFGQSGLQTQRTGLNKDQLLEMYNQPTNQMQSQSQFTQQPLQSEFTQQQSLQTQFTQQPLQTQITQQPLQNQFTQQPLQNQYTQQPLQQQFTQQTYGQPYFHQQPFPGQF